MADNQFTPVPISDYDLNPPPDDGTQVEENIVKYATTKEKLTDPIQTAYTPNNANLVTAFGKTINTDPDQNNSMAGSLAFASSSQVIAGNQVTPTRSHHLITTEGGGPTDEIHNINSANVSDGAIVVLRLGAAGQTITVRHFFSGAGNIRLLSGADVVLSDGIAALTLMLSNAVWYQLASIGASSFTSTEQTLVGNTDTILAHGLGAEPTMVTARARCVTADIGYSVGDVLLMPVYGGFLETQIGRGWGLQVDATNIRIVMGNGFIQVMAPSHVQSGMNVANWRYTFRAYIL